MAAAALTASPSLVPQRRSGWIYKPSWDLPLLIFSAILVPLPILAAWAAHASGLMQPQQAINVINITVATLVGGPHMFSTITYTFLDGRFRGRHPLYTKLAILLPVGVVCVGVYQYTLLITFFFTWASLHVLHQIIYLTDCYRERSAAADPRWSRLLDYGLILTGLYPIGLYKMSLRQFKVGGVNLPYPDWKSRNEVNPAVVLHQARQRFNLRAGGDEPEIIADPLHQRSRDRHASLQRVVGRLSLELKRHR